MASIHAGTEENASLSGNSDGTESKGTGTNGTNVHAESIQSAGQQHHEKPPGDIRADGCAPTCCCYGCADGETDDEGLGPVPNAHQNRPKKTQRRYFGLRRGPSNQQAFQNSDDYEQKYQRDAIGEELSQNARFYRVYLEEHEKYRSERVETWKDNLDVLLVFAGLFSAVVTTIVVEASRGLQPDYGQITSQILFQALLVQTGNTTAPPSNPEINFTPSNNARWVNRLWFMSLALSLSAALLAVVAKQWLQEYMSAPMGTPQERARALHQRHLSLQKWGVPAIISILPSLLYLSLFTFFVGLVLYLVPLDKPAAILVGAIAAIFYVAYLVTATIPLFHPVCPYKTPVSQLLYDVIQGLIDSIEAFFMRPVMRRLFGPWVLHVGGLSLTRRPLSERERGQAWQTAVYLDQQMVSWMLSFSFSPSATSISLQAISALPLPRPKTFNGPFRMRTFFWLPDLVESYRASGDVDTEQALIRSALAGDRLVREFLLLALPELDDPEANKSETPRVLRLSDLPQVLHRKVWMRLWAEYIPQERLRFHEGFDLTIEDASMLFLMFMEMVVPTAEYYTPYFVFPLPDLVTGQQKMGQPFVTLVEFATYATLQERLRMLEVACEWLFFHSGHPSPEKGLESLFDSEKDFRHVDEQKLDTDLLTDWRPRALAFYAASNLLFLPDTNRDHVDFLLCLLTEFVADVWRIALPGGRWKASHDGEETVFISQGTFNSGLSLERVGEVYELRYREFNGHVRQIEASGATNPFSDTQWKIIHSIRDQLEKVAAVLLRQSARSPPPLSHRLGFQGLPCFGEKSEQENDVESPVALTERPRFEGLVRPAQLVPKPESSIPIIVQLEYWHDLRPKVTGLKQYFAYF